MSGSSVSVGGSGLDVHVAGEGAPVLLLHGFTGSRETWAGQLPALQRRHRTIAPDLLGHGRSEAPADPRRYAVERQADDLAGLLTSLGVPKAAVVGYSMGARIALRLALDHPDRVERLVLESPSAGIADDEARARRRAADDALADDIESDGLAAFVDRWEAQPLFASHALLPADARETIRAERSSHLPLGLANALRGAGQGAMEPLHERLADIACPSIVVAGRLDPTGFERAADVASRIPLAGFHGVADAGHTPHLERPAEFGRLIDAFLATTSPHTH